MVSRKIESSRRAFLTNAGALLASGVVSRLASGKQDSVGSTAQRKQGKPMVIDCHAHVGISREPGTKEELSAPWDTEADPELILQHARDAGIDRTVIFPIDNTNYKEANEEIAKYANAIREGSSDMLGTMHRLNVVKSAQCCSMRSTT